jgi:cystathionine gamma-lyase
MEVSTIPSSSYTSISPSTSNPTTIMSSELGFSTRAIHIGSDPDDSTSAVIPAISLSTTFKQSSVGVHKGYEYSRSQNPSRRAFEETLAALEAGGASALAFASGSATTATLVQSLGPGAHILSVNDVYGGTYRYLSAVAPAQGVEVTFLDLERASDEEILGSLRKNTKLVWIESPTNPTLRVIDIRHIADLLESSTSSNSIEHRPETRPMIVVDNTFASPFYFSPLLSGADLALHSLTKYVNGHSDVVSGALILPSHHSNRSDPSSLLSRLTYLQNAIGAIPSPFDSWLAQRGAKTLGVRMKEHGLNALKVARHLENHPGVVKGDDAQRGVIYPGLRSHPKQRTVWKGLSPSARKWIESLPSSLLDPSSSSSGSPIALPSASSTEPLSFDFPFSGMVSFRIKGGEKAADKFLANTRIFTLAESLGGVESLAELPSKMTHGVRYPPPSLLTSY